MTPEDTNFAINVSRSPSKLCARVKLFWVLATLVVGLMFVDVRSLLVVLASIAACQLPVLLGRGVAGATGANPLSSWTAVWSSQRPRGDEARVVSGTGTGAG